MGKKNKGSKKKRKPQKSKAPTYIESEEIIKIYSKPTKRKWRRANEKDFHPDIQRIFGGRYYCVGDKNDEV